MRLIFLILFSCFMTHASGQGLAIGQWREHLPFNRGKMLADAGDKIYCATEDALFACLKQDMEIERHTRLSGLHDFGISSIAYSQQYKTLVIGYSNANIDLLHDNGSVYNISFIKKKNITGSKRINKIYIKDRLAYLACGFGIVVIDLEKQEVKDSYYIGASGKQMNVLDVTDDGSSLFAATDSGVYSGYLSTNLADFNNWYRILDDANNAGDFNHIVFFEGHIYVNYAKPNATFTSTDELWKLENSSWSFFTPQDLNASPKRHSMRVSGNEIIITNEYSVSIFNSSWQRIAYYDPTLYANAIMRDAIKDGSGMLWIADRTQGLIRVASGTAQSIVPSGPTSAYVADIQFGDDRMWIVHGPKSASWNAQDYPIDGFSYYKDGEWRSFNSFNTPSMSEKNFYSNMSLSVVPGESDHVRVASVTTGVLDFNDDAVTAYYTKDNSTLTPAVGNETQTIVHGIMHDKEGNLWVANSGVPNVFHVLKKDGTWKSMNMTGIINGAPFAGYILIDRNNFKWINLYGGSGTNREGLVVLDDNGTIDIDSDDRRIYIDSEDIIRCMAEDKEGQLWLGTDEGPQVIYSPSAAFDDNLSLQKILIRQDNTFQYLLETEIVTFIAVDGANRKWIGTQSSGIYLLSADGQEEIHHFTAENSPLFSDNITCIGINQKSGEVFIGTDKGLISYQSDAKEGGDDCETLIVYPNPVRPHYEGPIAISGLMQNARVKITDISGTLVYESDALGGQAIWNGRNLKGEKASTGVYLVFAADEAGENACITKLLFVK